MRVSSGENKKAVEFLEKFDNEPESLCWYELCDGISAMFYGMEDERTPEVMEYMKDYFQRMCV